MRDTKLKQNCHIFQASQALGSHYFSLGFHPFLYTVLYTDKFLQRHADWLFFEAENNPNRFGLAQPRDVPNGRDAARAERREFAPDGSAHNYPSWDERAGSDERRTGAT
jgi:hypothetical protein